MRIGIRLACALVALALGACQKNHSLYALTSTGSLIAFDTGKPATLNTNVAISGLADGVTLVQIQFLPSNATLYGLTSDHKLVTIDTSTGAATAASTAASFTSDTPSNPISAFDPVAGELRFIATSTNDLVNTSGLITTTGTAVAFDSGDTNTSQSPQLAALAYSNPVSGASTTTLYALDVTTQSLVRSGDTDASTPDSVNAGLVHTIGSVAVAFTASSGLAIVPSNGDAYAALAQTGAAASLYSVDLGGGSATLLDTIGGGDLNIISLAAAP